MTTVYLPYAIYNALKSAVGESKLDSVLLKPATRTSVEGKLPQEKEASALHEYETRGREFPYRYYHYYDGTIHRVREFRSMALLEWFIVWVRFRKLLAAPFVYSRLYPAWMNRQKYCLLLKNGGSLFWWAKCKGYIK